MAIFRRALPLFLGLVSLLSVLGVQVASAQSTAPTASTGYTSGALSVFPPNVGYGVGGPMMMLAASKDHTLFSPIYTDYEDINGDGSVDFTFVPTFRYYGYFDSSKCYTYKASAVGGARFEPVDFTLDKVSFQCSTSRKLWSGNFLNWATMTRLDVVRKILYGGHRKVDGTTDTTLEMAQVSMDAHSFVKYYAGADLRSYTPFRAVEDLGGAGLTICNRSTINSDPPRDADTDSQADARMPVMRVVKGNYSLWATIETSQVCRFKGEGDFDFGAKAVAFYKQYGPTRGDASKADPTAHKRFLPAVNVDTLSYTDGNNAVGYELAVRVQACSEAAPATTPADGAPSTLVGDESCQRYGSVLKPVGLLQKFGAGTDAQQAARAEFGLISGSYDSNLKGGALRKNIGSFNDEIKHKTGQFCYRLPLSDQPANCVAVNSEGKKVSIANGIVKSFDKMRLYGTGNYNGGGEREFLRPEDLANGNFPSWGNPISEMVVQALSYMSGRSLDQPTDVGRDAAVGLPTGVTPIDPMLDTTVDRASGATRKGLYGKGICRAMDVLAISSGTSSFDDKDGDNVYGLFDGTATTVGSTPSGGFTGLNGTSADNLIYLTDVVGQNEGINNTARSVGSSTSGFGSDCTNKQIGTAVTAGLAQVAGVCPEAPSVKGSYLGAGAAFYANTRAVRNLGTGPGALGPDTGAAVDRAKLPASALRIKTYAASMAGGVIRIEVPLNESGSKKVYITPESSWKHQVNGFAPNLGAPLTFRSIGASGPSADGTELRSASYVVTWNDTQFGGDYDMDIVGFIRWRLVKAVGHTADKPLFDLEVMTDFFNMTAGAMGTHGFSIIGTDASTTASPLPAGYNQDGRYLTHGTPGNQGSPAWIDGSDCQAYAAANNQIELALKCGYLNEGMPSTPGGSTRDGYAWPTSLTVNGVKKSVGFHEAVSTTTQPYTSSQVKKFRVTVGADDVTLREPLWYMAKYGSFDTGEKAFAAKTEQLPDNTKGTTAVKNWDSARNDGVTNCGAACGDGEPDGYFLARRPDLLAARLEQLLTRLVAGSNAAPAVSSTQLSNDSLKYVVGFDKPTLSGSLKAFAVQANGLFGADPIWDASLKLAAAGPGGRQIITNLSAGGLQRGIAFSLDESNLQSTDAQGYLSSLTSGVSNAGALVNYIRGDTTEEGKLFRKREGGVLGMVVSSTPWVQNNQSSARFTDADFPGAPSYRSFLVSHRDRANALWVGANDGMLHGFNASTGAPVLSFVPSPVAGRLALYASKSATADLALMDGSPYVADVLLGEGESAAWARYLFSSMGRGGRAVFALDVTTATEAAATTTATTTTTTPTPGVESRASSIFKWMFSAQDDADLGHVLTDPVRDPVSGQASPVMRMNNGKFGILVPNGFGSANGNAALFILFADGPRGSPWARAGASGVQDPSYAKLVARQNDGDNGLMGATWVDLDSNGTADVVYATDLKGRVWKFDIRSSNPANWGPAFIGSYSVNATVTTGAVPFFTALNGETPLPITTAPAVYFPSFGGTMVTFATGKAINAGDFGSATPTHRFFSVWDRGGYVGDQVQAATADASGNTPTLALPGTGTNRGLESAAFQKIELRRNDQGFVYRVSVDANGVETPMLFTDVPAFNPATQDGWYFNFPSSGEAMIFPLLARRDTVFFTSLRPESNEASSCDLAPLSTLFAFNPITGRPVPGLLTTMVVTNPDGTQTSYTVYGANTKDQRLTISLDGREPTSAGATACPVGKIKVGFLGKNVDANGCAPASSLRIQWREIPGMKTK